MSFTPEILNEPDKNILFAHVASILLDRGKLDEAITICENGLKSVPSYAQGHFILARCYQLKNKPEQAKAEFERVLRYDPNHIAAIREIALFHRRNKMDDLYKKFLHQLVTLDPTNEIILEDARNTGVYVPWIHPDTEVRDSMTEEEKIDLSQFENRDDDFTTIMHGLFKPDDKSEIREEVPGTVLAEEPEDEEIVADEIPFQNEEYSSTLKTQDDLIQSLDTSATDMVKEEEVSMSEDELYKGEEAEGAKDQEEVKDFKEPEKEQTTAEANLLTMEHYNQKDETTTDTERNGDETTIIFEGEISIDTDHLSKPARTEQKYGDDTDEGETPDVFNTNPKLISQTLAEILVSQKKYVEARNMFVTLKAQNPENTKYDKKIEFLSRIIELNQQP